MEMFSNLLSHTVKFILKRLKLSMISKMVEINLDETIKLGQWRAAGDCLALLAVPSDDAALDSVVRSSHWGPHEEPAPAVLAADSGQA